MTEINRREFVGKVAAAAGALVVSSPSDADAPRGAASLKRVKLGKSGLKTSVLGIGTGTIGGGHQSNQTRLGQEKFTALFHHAFDRGVTFFDVADSYGSHPYLREAIRSLPREKFVIMTKTFSRKAEEVRADLDRFRQELDVDYIDLVLMHCVTEPDWNALYRGVKDVLSEAKQKGVIRAHGCSCHSYPAMEAALADPWVDVDLARFNPWGLYMDPKPGDTHGSTPESVRDLLRRMRAAGKGVIGMKILGQGDAMKGPDRAAKIAESLRWAFGSGAVDMMSIGFEAPEQIDEIVSGIRVALAELDG